MKEVTANQLDNLPVTCFYTAVHIYLKKNQVVNRKLSCSSNVVFLKLNLESREDKLKTNLIQRLKESSCSLSENVIHAVSALSIEFCVSELDELKDFDESKDGIYFSVDRMVPRNLQKFQTCILATFIGKRLVLSAHNPVTNEFHCRHKRFFCTLLRPREFQQFAACDRLSILLFEHHEEARSACGEPSA